MRELTVDEEMLVSGGVACGNGKGTGNTVIYSCDDSTGKCAPDGDMCDPS